MKTDGTLSRTIAIIRPGSDLSQPARPDQRVIAMAAHRQLDGIGDDLAADQRGFHPGMAHRDAVGDGDGGEFARRAAAPRRRPSWPPAPGATSAMLQGAASFQVVATPTSGWLICSSVRPMAIEEGAVRRALRPDRDVPARHARFVETIGLRISSGISASPVGFGFGKKHRSGGIKADQSFGRTAGMPGGDRQQRKTAHGKRKTSNPGADHIPDSRAEAGQILTHRPLRS